MPPHALITGGSRGIGLAIAQLLAHNAYSCTLVARSPSHLSSAVSTLPTTGTVTHRTITGDVSSPDFWASITSQGGAEELQDRRSIDVLVNCAGVTQEKLLVRTSDEDIQKIMDTNLTGMIIGTRHLLREKFIRSRGTEDVHDRGKEKRDYNFDRPVIINVASLLGLRGGRGAVAYAASKAGVLGFTRALAAEVGFQGIRVNAVVPGYIETDMTSDLSASSDLLRQIPLRRFGSPNEVADAAWFLIKNQYANNCVVNLDGGLSAT